MAQLTDDCFAFSGPLLPIATVEAMIRDRIMPVEGLESVPLGAAFGRVLAQDLIAPLDLPPFDNSAVDGFAVRHADLAPSGETRLAVTDRVTAGRSATHPLGPGSAIRIFTGAPMPPDADTVFMQEDVRTEASSVIVPEGLTHGANRRHAGEDVRKGAVAVPGGRMLNASHVALAAALGMTALTVHRRVRVALFSTGDEIVEPGATRTPAALFDANRFLLRGLIERLGSVVTDLGILKDDAVQLRAAIGAAAQVHDLVLTSGGVSAGEADHVRPVIEQIGRLVFWRVGIKPGRPVAMGVVNGAAFVGLPGNPVAVFVTFARIVRPLLLRLAGAAVAPLVPFPVRATFAYRKREGRREYVRVSLRRTANGDVEAIKFPQDGAGILSSLTETDGLVELDESVTRVAPGDSVGFLSYAALVG